MTDTAPRLGQDPIDGVKPTADDLTLWSVTTILGALDKPGLVYWAAEETAKAAVARANTLATRIGEDGTQAVIDSLKNARFTRVDGERSAADLGTAVHAACEEYALTGIRPQVDDEVRPFLDRFDGWLDEFQPTYQATEVMVFNGRHGYAGTCDGFLTVDGVRLIIDYKTSRKSANARGQVTAPYPETVALQLAAYRYAEGAAVWRPRRMEKFRRRYYLLNAAEREAAAPVPEVDGGAVIHITPEHCDMYPIRCDEEIFEAFLYVEEAARWLFQTSKEVMGPPMRRARHGTPAAPAHIAAMVD